MQEQHIDAVETGMYIWETEGPCDWNPGRKGDKDGG